MDIVQIRQNSEKSDTYDASTPPYIKIFVGAEKKKNLGGVTETHSNATEL